VELARAGNVSAITERPGEVDLRVATDGGLKSAAVTLYLDDDEWTCDCDSTADACVHAAAATIALNRARMEGKTLVSTALAHVGYRLRRHDGELVFDRALVGASETPLTTSISEASKGTKLAATQADMTVEVLLGTRPRGALIKEHWQKLWPALSECEDVQLDGAKVSFGPSDSIESLIVEDAREGFRLTLGTREGIERFKNGPAHSEGRLFLPTPPALGERDLLALRQGQTITDVPAFVTDLLPRLQAALPVTLRSKRVPVPTDLPAFVAFEIAPQGPGLSILATLVYGDPPTARIDKTGLVWLGGPLPKRRPREEDQLRQAAAAVLDLKIGERTFVNAEDAPELLSRIARFTGRAPATKAAMLSDASVHATMQSGVLSLSLEAGSEVIDHASLLQALRGGQALISLRDGRFARIPPTLRDLDLVARLLHGRGELSPPEQVEATRLLRELNTPLPPDLTPLAALLDGKAEHTALPSDLQATLRDYQQLGVDWLALMRTSGLGALLADDMGLGKTLQTIASLAPEPTLVVAPTSVLSVWERELARFRPSLSVARFHGPRRKLGDSHIVLTSYGTLRMDETILAAREWSTIVLDEAQAIKNPDSQAARACFTLKAKRRIALSGTPVENSLDELWSVFHFLNPGYLGARDAFAKGLGARIAAGERSAVQTLRTRIRPFVLRRTKDEVARDLPPRTDNVLTCDLSEEERAIYDSVHHASVPEVLAALGEEGSVLSALEALLRLRQAASHPRLLPGHGAFEGASAKLTALMASIETLVSEGHKALVFSQWTSFLDLVEPELQTRALGFCRLDGATVDRAKVTQAFEAPDGPPVMLISLKAGGTGLTLTAADYVFLLDPWWNPAVEEQAAARAHRIGQTKPVFVYRLIAKDTVEERLLALQAQKRALFDAALGDEALAKRLTRDDIRALLA
jgi:superfamily II DNA or RNA helicase